MGQSLTAEQVLEQSGANLNGKVAIVTGASTGLGKETARVLAKGGARVIMACRNREKAEKAAEDLRMMLKGAGGGGKKAPTTTSNSSSSFSSHSSSSASSSPSLPSASLSSANDNSVIEISSSALLGFPRAERTTDPDTSPGSISSSATTRSTTCHPDEPPLVGSSFSFASNSYDQNFRSFSINTSDLPSPSFSANVAQTSRRKIGSLEVMIVDLSDLQSVRRFVKQFLSLNIPLHLLVCNAGVMACPFALTKQGFEYQFGTNYVAHFFLTRLLIEKLKNSSSSRIVIVSSVYHKYGKIEWGGFLNDPEKYKEWAAYAQSKLALILFTKELDRRLSAEIERVQTSSPTRPHLPRPNSTGLVSLKAAKRRSSFNPPLPPLSSSVGDPGISALAAGTSAPTTLSDQPQVMQRSVSTEFFRNTYTSMNRMNRRDFGKEPASATVTLPIPIPSPTSPTSPEFRKIESSSLPEEPSSLLNSPPESTPESPPLPSPSSQMHLPLTISNSPDPLSHHFGIQSMPTHTSTDQLSHHFGAQLAPTTTESSSDSEPSQTSSSSTLTHDMTTPELVSPPDGILLASERTLSSGRVALDIGPTNIGGHGGIAFSEHSSRRSSLEAAIGAGAGAGIGGSRSRRDSADRSPSFKVRPKQKTKTGRCTVHVLHPGTIKTDLYRELGTTGSIWKFMGTPFFNSVGEGAATILYCCLAPWLDLKGGGFYSDCAEIKPSRRARNMEDARKLWWETERMIKNSLERDKLERRKAKQAEEERKQSPKQEDSKQTSSPPSSSATLTSTFKERAEDDIEKFITQEMDRKEKTRAKLKSLNKDKFDEREEWATEMYPDSDSSNSRSETRPESYYGSGFAYNSPPPLHNLEDHLSPPTSETDMVAAETPTFRFLSTTGPGMNTTDQRTISEPSAITPNQFSQTPPKPLSGPPSLPPHILPVPDSPEQSRPEPLTSSTISSSNKSSPTSSPQFTRSSSRNRQTQVAPPPQSPPPIFTHPSDWVPDSHRLCCFLCGRPFSLFNRRHHCRQCGEVVCGLCSATRIEGQRYCDTCKKLAERREARQRHWG